jgi:gamma-glutamyltranspeptidase/glutathione hydrolase
LKEGIPFHGFLSAAVPGLVSTWFDSHKRFGKLPIEECLAQAIDYAVNGFPAYPRFISRMKLHLKNYPGSELFSHMGIRTDLALGDLVIQSDLGETLKAIAAGGRDAFYKGVIAEKIIAATDGWMNAEDLSNHKTRVEPPLTVNYRGLNVYGQPPPTQGIILMEELLLASEFDVKR